MEISDNKGALGLGFKIKTVLFLYFGPHIIPHEQFHFHENQVKFINFLNN